MSAAYSDVATLAQNIARNWRVPVFPVGEDKHPTLKRWPERASRDPDQITELWRTRPGPLIGIPTGDASCVSVLDVDSKHDEATLWWRENCHRLLPTRVYETRSGGLHLYFRHCEGVKNTQGKLCKGVDTRGQGGFIVCWFAAGFRCLDPSSLRPWPPWLLASLTRPATPPQRHTAVPTERALTGIAGRVAAAQEGERNAVLYWAACRCTERQIGRSEIEGLLIPAAMQAGLSEIEARRTIASAMGRVAA